MYRVSEIKTNRLIGEYSQIGLATLAAYHDGELKFLVLNGAEKDGDILFLCLNKKRLYKVEKYE